MGIRREGPFLKREFEEVVLGSRSSFRRSRFHHWLQISQSHPAGPTLELRHRGAHHEGPLGAGLTGAEGLERPRGCLRLDKDRIETVRRQLILLERQRA